MDLDKAKKIKEAYEKVASNYGDFANAVKSIAESILKANGFAYQIVSARRKDPESLYEKMKNGLKVTRFEKVDDLAGCRVLFYVGTSVDEFLALLKEDFVVEKQNLRYSADDYNGMHLIVKLKDDRCKLPEYAKYKDMRCEIQLTTVLYHAWAETGHDVVYKDLEGIKQFDPETFETIKNRLATTMRDHIKSAQHDFDHIAQTVKKVREGKKIFDPAFILSVLGSNSLDEMQEGLKTLIEYIDKFEKVPEGIDLFDITRKIIDKSEKLKVQKRKTPWGDMEGASKVEVIISCIGLLRRLFGQKPQEVFKLLLDLSIHKEKAIRDSAIDAISKISKINHHALKKVGYAIQDLATKELGALGFLDKAKYIEAVLVVAQNALDTNISITEAPTYDSITIGSGSIVVQEHIVEIRNRAIDLVVEIYTSTKDRVLKKRIIELLQHATETPHTAYYGEDMEGMVIDNATRITAFYINLTKTDQHFIVKEIDEQFYWLNRRFGESKIPNLAELKATLLGNEGYQLYKTFVGYENRTSDETWWEKDSEKRSESIEKYLSKIPAKGSVAWTKKITTMTKDIDVLGVGEFARLNGFLFNIGKSKPLYAFQLLKHFEKKNNPFLVHLISGLWLSKSKSKTRNQMLYWIKAGKHLEAISYLPAYTNDFDSDLVLKILKKAAETKNVTAVNNIIEGIVRNPSIIKDTKKIFIEAISALESFDMKEKNSWINYFFAKGVDDLLSSMNYSDVVHVLKNLLTVERISHEVEIILERALELDPKLFVDFFEDRIKIKSKRPKDILDHYDAIPHRFYSLDESLKSKADTLIPLFFEWYQKTGDTAWLYQWEASEMLSHIFPDYSSVLEAELKKLVLAGTEESREIVYSILRKYEGEPFLFSVVIEMVGYYKGKPEYESVKNELMSCLVQTGVVAGADGFVVAYMKKIAEIEELTKDGDSATKDFFSSYARSLGLRVDYESKRVEQSEEMRKREFEG